VNPRIRESSRSRMPTAPCGGHLRPCHAPQFCHGRPNSPHCRPHTCPARSRDRRDAQAARPTGAAARPWFAATTIHGRFLALVDGRPTPDNVLALPVEDMRAAGLSANKVASIRDLATKCVEGTVELDRLSALGDDVIISELITVRGIGVWTAQMFLMFQLGHLDVWPVLDLGVRSGFARLYEHDTPLSPAQMQQEGERFTPYRSIVAWYCWRAVDTTT
jgi:hypothetical protein